MTYYEETDSSPQNSVVEIGKHNVVLESFFCCCNQYLLMQRSSNVLVGHIICQFYRKSRIQNSNVNVFPSQNVPCGLSICKASFMNLIK